MKRFAVFILWIVALIPLAWIVMHKYEGNAPEVTADLSFRYLKKNSKLSLNIEDSGAGLRDVTISIRQGNYEKRLFEKDYPSPSIKEMLLDKGVKKDHFEFPIAGTDLKLSAGEAILEIVVTDASWRHWNGGNTYKKQHTFVVDNTPPRLAILSKHHNLVQGGAGVIIYRLYESDIKSGVYVGDNFFPGHSGMFKDASIHTAFFALSHTQGQGTQMWVSAEDAAGNKTRKGFPHYIRSRRFKRDTIKISNRFLDVKMPRFDLGNKEDEFNKTKVPYLSKFLEINRMVRQANVDKILGATVDTRPEMMWSGKFGRLAGSANRAGFADHRIYKHGGRVVDQADHLGIDLASTVNARVGAANSGRVIFSDSVGIFGNSIIIDHGFGLASLYSHLSSRMVQVGDFVTKGDLIGYTGTTGLVMGDHLHFSMIVHNTFVNPLEWWDGHWIKNNITHKIEAVRSLSSN